MSYRLSLDELRDVSLLYERRKFPGPELVLPETARRYLEHAIAPRNRLASAVRLQMHGELKLKTWLPFTAEQVIRWDRGMIWKATVYRSRLPIRGFDRLLDGQGEMQWKFLGILPVSRASGPDTTRSTVGRMQAEVIWLPSVLCDPEVSWTETDTTHTQAHFALQGEPTTLELNIDQDGRVKTASLPRWGESGREVECRSGS